jgi:hypothetical protein
VNDVYMDPENGDFNKVFIRETATNLILSGPHKWDPDNLDDKDNTVVCDKLDDLQRIYDVISLAFKELKDSGAAFGNDKVVRLFAASLLRQHNTDCASIIRTIRYGLEEYEKLATKRGKVDARNEVAVEWIKAGREADRIPFI